MGCCHLTSIDPALCVNQMRPQRLKTRGWSGQWASSTSDIKFNSTRIFLIPTGGFDLSSKAVSARVLISNNNTPLILPIAVWRCPFGQDQSPLRVQGRHTHCPWTTGSTHLPRAIKHLVQMHLEDLPVDLQYALHPDGRQHAKATVTRRLKELGINDHGAPTTTKSSTSAQGKGDELSDLDDLSDDEHGAAYADLPEDRIPSGLVDTDGLLIRT